MSAENLDFQMRLGRVESLVRGLEASTDVVAREGARELLQTVMDLHGRGLERMLRICMQHAALNEVVSDPHISNLLLLHGVHPLSLADRVARAISQLGMELAADGAEAELSSVHEDVVSVRLRGSRALEGRLREAIEDAAPDAKSVNIEVDPSVPPGLVQLRVRRPEVDR
jgi:hypothetical protein